MGAPARTIPYIDGFNIKPKSISSIGVVTFTDGTNDIVPNQIQCERYGYIYDKATGTCSTFNYNSKINTNNNNTNSTIRGNQNITETGTNNTRPNHGTVHGHLAGTGPTNNTAYGGAAQPSDNNSNTEPEYRTICFLSAPEEPAGGNVALWGSNF